METGTVSSPITASVWPAAAGGAQFISTSGERRSLHVDRKGRSHPKAMGFIVLDMLAIDMIKSACQTPANDAFRTKGLLIEFADFSEAWKLRIGNVRQMCLMYPTNIHRMSCNNSVHQRTGFSVGGST